MNSALRFAAPLVLASLVLSLSACKPENKEDTAKTETERYMAWPGQALGYKIGSLKIVALRERASAALGNKFSLPAFHAVVLGDGTVPLALLEEKVERWIASQQ